MAPYYGADHDLDSKMCQKTARILQKKNSKLIPDLMNQICDQQKIMTHLLRKVLIYHKI